MTSLYRQREICKVWCEVHFFVFSPHWVIHSLSFVAYTMISSWISEKPFTHGWSDVFEGYCSENFRENTYATAKNVAKRYICMRGADRQYTIEVSTTWPVIRKLDTSNANKFLTCVGYFHFFMTSILLKCCRGFKYCPKNCCRDLCTRVSRFRIFESRFRVWDCIRRKYETESETESV